MAYPRFRKARAHKFIKRATGSDLSLATTAITDLGAATNGPGAAGFDIALPAQVGDILEWGFNGLLESAAVVTSFDIYTIVSSSRVNPFGAGLSASLGSTVGVLGWYAVSGRANNLVGSAMYTVQAGDISAGIVTLRPHYAATSSTARTLYCNASDPLMMWAKNLGPGAV
jgi:hypothetical protein